MLESFIPHVNCSLISIGIIKSASFFMCLWDPLPNFHRIGHLLANPKPSLCNAHDLALLSFLKQNSYRLLTKEIFLTFFPRSYLSVLLR